MYYFMDWVFMAVLSFLTLFDSNGKLTKCKKVILIVKKKTTIFFLNTDFIPPCFAIGV